MSGEEFELRLKEMEADWPDSMDLGLAAPSLAEDRNYVELYRTQMRQAASPGAAMALLRMNRQIDVRNVLPAIRVPTLIMYRRDARFGHGAGAWRDDRDDLIVPADEAAYMAERIPGSRLVELPGRDHLAWVGEVDALVGEVEEFLTGVRRTPQLDTVLTTILFTDIVDSTELVAELGDRGWRDLIQRHNELIRRQLDRFRGQEVDCAGDGFLASFDGPARAIRCAHAVSESVTALGLRIRAGIHTGECELVDGKPTGIAVHIASRIAELADPGEVLVSSTVRDLVVGSRLEFGDRGEHELKGVPNSWHLCSLRQQD